MHNGRLLSVWEFFCMVTDLVLYTGYCKEYVAVILCPDLMC